MALAKLAGERLRADFDISRGKASGYIMLSSNIIDRMAACRRKRGQPARVKVAGRRCAEIAWPR